MHPPSGGFVLHVRYYNVFVRFISLAKMRLGRRERHRSDANKNGGQVERGGGNKVKGNMVNREGVYVARERRMEGDGELKESGGIRK